MDKDRIAAIAAIAARGEQIKTNSAEYLWFVAGSDPRYHRRTSRRSLLIAVATPNSRNSGCARRAAPRL
jgi:hypothetical protein